MFDGVLSHNHTNHTQSVFSPSHETLLWPHVTGSRLEEGLTHLLSAIKSLGRVMGLTRAGMKTYLWYHFKPRCRVWRSCIIIYLKRIENILKIHGCNSRMTYKVSKNFWQILAQARVTQSGAEIYKTLHKQQYWTVSTSNFAFFSWDWRLDWRKCFAASS